MLQNYEEDGCVFRQLRQKLVASKNTSANTSDSSRYCYCNFVCLLKTSLAYMYYL